MTESKEQIKSTSCLHDKLPIKIDTIDGEKYIHTSFAMYVMNNDEEGLYNLFFHSCPNYKYETRRYVNFTVRKLETKKSYYFPYYKKSNSKGNFSKPFADSYI